MSSGGLQAMNCCCGRRERVEQLYDDEDEAYTTIGWCYCCWLLLGERRGDGGEKRRMHKYPANFAEPDRLWTRILPEAEKLHGPLFLASANVTRIVQDRLDDDNKSVGAGRQG
eukprot:scaffold3886_cov58-Cyclotella_meneghiniana.AAC.4